jgi:FHA domain
VKVTRCVPLVGQGVIVRYGALVGVTARTPDPDPLLSALAEAASSAGDGGDLVVRAARAASRGRGQQAWACAGVTTDGGVAVQVHGRAVAAVRVDGGPEVTLTADGSVTPVSRKFSGATVALGLVVGATAPPDPRFWLGDGVVCGGGLAVTVTADVPGMATPRPDGQVGWHLPTADAPALEAPPASTRAAGTRAAGTGGEHDPHAVLVDGVLCARDHFNDPAARFCRQCGIGLDQPPRNFTRGPRPPLGVLVLDDGTRLPLDSDYVVGREPTFDSDVLEGRSRPLRINDANGTVSRLHLRISLVGWQVEVSDLGSANGSVLQSSDGERRLPPHVPMMIEPGARIAIGHRSMRYVA